MKKLDYPLKLHRLTPSEIDAFNDWVDSLVDYLHRCSAVASSGSSASVQARTIKGLLSLLQIDFPGAEIDVQDDGFKLSTVDGSYIEVTNGTINIKANIIT